MTAESDSGVVFRCYGEPNAADLPEIAVFAWFSASCSAGCPHPAASRLLAVAQCARWITDPGYAKNFAGLVQSLTVGLPAYGGTPSWMFFRNSLVSDAIFTALFVACMSFGRTRAPATAGEPLVRTA